MLGWLIVNSFVETAKFHELYDFLCKAASEQGITLEIKASADLLCDTESNFEGFLLPDFVLFWDKDIYLAKRLEKAGVRLFNTAEAVEICDNKILTGLALIGKVKMPKTIIAPKTFEGVGYCNKSFLKDAVSQLGLPVIIKEAYGSFGQQVYLAKTCEEAETIIDSLGHKDFLIQEFIQTSEGRDVRVNVVGGKAVCAMMRYNDSDFRSNITNGGKMKPYSLTKEQERVAVNACRAIGLDFAGVDLLFGQNDEPIVCEVNSNPHFKTSYECTGVDMSREIIKYIRESLS